MKSHSSVLAVYVVVAIVIMTTTTTQTSAFTVLPSSSSRTSTSSTSRSTFSSSALSMGLFDFFSPEAQKERERKKRELVEEQERLQKAIMDRRRNPELMEEYEQKVSIRRELKMKGDFETASKVDVYEGYKDQTLLDGTEGSTGE
jgi:hypothetical protein